MIVVSFNMGFVQHQPHINKEIKNAPNNNTNNTNNIITLVKNEDKKSEQELVTIVEHVFEHLEHKHPAENKEKKKIQIAAFIKGEKNQKEVNARVLSTVVEHVFEHVQTIRKEFSALGQLTEQYKNSSEGRNVPCLDARLKLYCRLALLNRMDHEKWIQPENTADILKNPEIFFKLPKMDSDKFQKLTLSFFKKSMPSSLKYFAISQLTFEKTGGLQYSELRRRDRNNDSD
jgi:hypothetical protein